MESSEELSYHPAHLPDDFLFLEAEEGFNWKEEANLTFSNSTNSTDGYIPYSMRPETYIVPILFAIIFVIGVMGNGTLIGIFVKHRTMRNVPNIFKSTIGDRYIVSLAVGDLCVILFCVPFTSVLYTVEGWPWGEFMCKFSEFIKDLSIGVSVFTLTALSADRYFAIVDPMRKLHGRRATKVTCITIAGIWVFSVVVALPSAMFSYIKVFADPEDESKKLYVCYPFPPEFGDKYPQVMVLLRFLVYYAIPLFFIASFYIIMAHHLIKSTRNMPGEAQGQAKQIQARKKVAKMILSFVLIFAFCFLPSHVFLLWFYWSQDAEFQYNAFWHAFRITGFCLSFINSCINPITLYCVSGTFRKQFNEHLFCCFCEPDGRSRPRRRAGFGCGCVSLSSAGPYFAGENQYRSVYTPARTMSNSAKIKRKATWDTQSTLTYHNHNHTHNHNCQHQHHSHNFPHNHNHSPVSPNYQGRDTPTTTSTYAPEREQRNNLNGSFPLHNHPYQKDYQEYLNRINALENGDLPQPLEKSRSQVAVTSFINSPNKESSKSPRSDSGCSEDCGNVDDALILEGEGGVIVA